MRWVAVVVCAEWYTRVVHTGSCCARKWGGCNAGEESDHAPRAACCTPHHPDASALCPCYRPGRVEPLWQLGGTPLRAQLSFKSCSACSTYAAVTTNSSRLSANASCASCMRDVPCTLESPRGIASLWWLGTHAASSWHCWRPRHHCRVESCFTACSVTVPKKVEKNIQAGDVKRGHVQLGDYTIGSCVGPHAACSGRDGWHRQSRQRSVAASCESRGTSGAGSHGQSSD
jgi:hypothetical protein